MACAFVDVALISGLFVSSDASLCVEIARETEIKTETEIEIEWLKVRVFVECLSCPEERLHNPISNGVKCCQVSSGSSSSSHSGSSSNCWCCSCCFRVYFRRSCRILLQFQLFLHINTLCRLLYQKLSHQLRTILLLRAPYNSFSILFEFYNKITTKSQMLSPKNSTTNTRNQYN